MDEGRVIRKTLFWIYVVCCLLAVCWPGYARFGNSIEPYVLGIPFSLAWVVGWVIATFIVLSLFHVTRPRRRDGR